MKRFSRSVGGKTALFIAFTLCVCLIVGCAAGIFAMIEGDIYTTSEEETLYEYRQNNVYSKIRDYLRVKLVQGGDSDIPEYYDIEAEAIKEDGQILIRTGGYSQAAKDDSHENFVFRFGIQINNEGEITELVRVYPDGAYLSSEYEEMEVRVYANPSVELSRGESYVNMLIHAAYTMKFAIYPLTLLLLIACIAIFIALMCAAGRRPDSDELFPGPFFKVPFELILIIAFLSVAVIFYIADSCGYEMQAVIAIIGCIVLINVFLGLSMSFASRVKQHVLISGSIIYKILSFIFKIIGKFFGALKRLFTRLADVFHNIKLVWRGALIILGISLIELFVIVASDGEQEVLVVLWMIEKLILIPALLFALVTMRKLQVGAENIASGDLSYKTEVRGFFRDFRIHAENLNSISSGMAQAVERQLKSERMKTELITNVSHDIKTPLTSIINYSSLISGETCDNPKIGEYSAVLLRQSEKLKRLIEDLVEASKASTGNLEVSLVPCDAAVFISQAGGEYEEKIAAAGLSLVTKLPEGEVKILADSRRMWRVFDNLMNNICKYSQAGTRVYLSLEAVRKEAVITFKNTSRDELDISPDELMERFVRGDTARNTEGNGLGLSIARSLTELQGGSFALDVDGDLFKVTLSFPMI